MIYPPSNETVEKLHSNVDLLLARYNGSMEYIMWAISALEAIVKHPIMHKKTCESWYDGQCTCGLHDLLAEIRKNISKKEPE